MVTAGFPTTISTTDGNPLQIIPPQSGKMFSGGSIVDAGLYPIGWTLDGPNATDSQYAYLDTLTSDNLPAGTYPNGLYIKRATSTNATGISAKIY